MPDCSRTKSSENDYPEEADNKHQDQQKINSTADLRMQFLLSKGYSGESVQKMLNVDACVNPETISGNLFPIPYNSKQTISALLNFAAKNHSDRTYIKSKNGEQSYGQVLNKALNLMMYLQRDGVKPGDTIALWSDWNPQIPVIFWATMMTGATFIPLDCNASEEYVEEMICSTKPALLFTDKEIESNLTKTISINEISFNEKDISSNFKKAETEIVVTKEDQIAVVLFTSGTTGKPKGVMLSHGALFRSSLLMSEIYNMQGDERIWSLGDIHTMSGLRNPLLVPLHQGSSVWIDKKDSNFFAIPKQIKEHQITILSCAPLLIQFLNKFTKKIKGEDLASLKMILCTGNKLPVEIVNDFQTIFSIPLLNYYGLTETCGLCVANLPGDNHTNTGDIGFAVNAIAEVVDENGNRVPTDQQGELRVFSDLLFKGYWPEIADYGDMIKDNWLYTGDYATISAKGVINLVGRKKNFIKNVHTELIYPQEIELCLAKLDYVEDVAVAGKERDDGLEDIIAFVVVKNPEISLKSELKRFVISHLGDQKKPDRIIFVDSIPKGAHGKIKRNLLLEMLE